MKIKLSFLGSFSVLFLVLFLFFASLLDYFPVLYIFTWSLFCLFFTNLLDFFPVLYFVLDSFTVLYLVFGSFPVLYIFT